jgi:hypothetical protein
MLHSGNVALEIAEDDQCAKLHLVVDTAREVWN